MHSKVIIASLVCMLAASFGGNLTANYAEAPNQTVEEACCANAPNEDRREIILTQDIVDSGTTFVASLGIYASESLYDSFHRWMNPSNLSVERFYYPNGAVGAYIQAPTTNGQTFISFIAGGKEYGTIYIYTQNGHSCASSLSANDARAKYFMEFVATSSEKTYYPCSSGSSITTSTAYNAVKRYADYVYGSGDITASTNPTNKSTSGEASLPVTIHVDWKQSSTYYNVNSMRLNLYFNGVPISTAVRRTNINGVYTINLSASQIRNKTISSLQVGLFADTTATLVKDNNGFNYPYLYNYSSSTYLSNLSKLEYHFTINPSVSDRSSSYIIAQAEMPARWYFSTRFSRYISTIETKYPAAKTCYYSDSLRLRKGITNSWDVIGHEYCHHVCEELNLCGSFNGDDHNYNEDLSNYHGFVTGSRFAYSEGLATYIALSSLVEYGKVFGGYANSIADYKYDDNLNNIHVNYSSEKYGSPSSPHGACVEASVTRVMVKLLSSSSISDINMMNVILNAGSYYCTIIDFVEEYIATYSQDTASVYPVLDSENITEQYVALSGISRVDDWTIMLYFCGSSNLVDQAAEELQSILEVAGQPSNVNILVYYGGSRGWLQYAQCDFPINGYIGFYGRIENNTFIKEDNVGDNMGDPNTLAEFVNWGIDEYPAKKLGLVLFNHGNALNGVCFDSAHYDDCLTNSEVAQAMETVYSDHPSMRGKFEFIGYDACLMQLQDIAEFNSNYFNYMVASEEYTYGWNWNGFIQNIYNRASTVNALKALCDDFIPKNDEVFIRKHEERKACLSVLDLSKMKAYRNKLENLAINIKNTVSNNRNEFLNVVEQSMHFANVVNLEDPSRSEYKYEKYGTIDGYDFLTKLAASSSFTQYSSQINTVKAAYSSVVAYNVKAVSSTPSYGLTMHVCLDAYPQQTYDINETHFYNWRSLFC